MKNVHLVIADLFLPKELAAEACAGLHLPALEKLLARGASTGSAGTDVAETSMEALLCAAFGLAGAGELPVAPVAAAFDGLGEGCWLCADPVHLALQGKQLVLFPEPEVCAEEAARFCAGLNEHFVGQGLEFFAPHPQRWYVRLDELADIETVPLSLAAGRGIGELLPGGADATRWRQVFNEVQMLLFAHPLNAEREARGIAMVNSVWLWGGGSFAAPPSLPYDCVASDDVLAEMFAAAVGVPFVGWPQRWDESFLLEISRIERGGASQGRVSDPPLRLRSGMGCSSQGGQLLVFTGLRTALRRGDLGGWRVALQEFETDYAQPLLRALRAGKIARLQIDVTGGDGNWRTSLSRADAWAFWRRGRGLAV